MTSINVFNAGNTPPGCGTRDHPHNSSPLIVRGHHYLEDSHCAQMIWSSYPTCSNQSSLTILSTTILSLSTPHGLPHPIMPADTGMNSHLWVLILWLYLFFRLNEALFTCTEMILIHALIFSYSINYERNFLKKFEKIFEKMLSTSYINALNELIRQAAPLWSS